MQQPLYFLPVLFLLPVRVQYPFTSVYPFTNFKSQGQTIESVIIYLAKPLTGGFNVYDTVPKHRKSDQLRDGLRKNFQTRYVHVNLERKKLGPRSKVYDARGNILF